MGRKATINVISQQNPSKDTSKRCIKIIGDPDTKNFKTDSFLTDPMNFEVAKDSKSELKTRINKLGKPGNPENEKICHRTENIRLIEKKLAKAKVEEKIIKCCIKADTTPSTSKQQNRKRAQSFFRVPSHMDSASDNASVISTNTYYVTNSNCKNSCEFACKAQPAYDITSASHFSTSTFNVMPMKINWNSRKKDGKFQWESDKYRYREIVKDIMSQYERTKGFLKQSQNVQRLPKETFKCKNVEKNSSNEKKNDVANQMTSIVEYRKKVMSEYNALPPLEYRSKVLQDSKVKSKALNFSSKGNLFVAHCAGEEMDSDVKDYHPNVQKVLDSQVYVDLQTLGRRRKTLGKVTNKVMSLYQTARSQGDVLKQPIREKQLQNSLCEFRCFFSKPQVQKIYNVRRVNSSFIHLTSSISVHSASWPA